MIKSGAAFGVVGIAAVATVVVGCGTATKNIGGREMPEWIEDPARVADMYPGKVCGTGFATGIRNLSLGREVADQKAISRVAASLGINPRGHTEARESAGGASGEEKTGTDRYNARTEGRYDMLLSGVTIRKRYATEEGDWYALACYDPEGRDTKARNLLRPEAANQGAASEAREPDSADAGDRED
jgi:hypothetical protein